MLAARAGQGLAVRPCTKKGPGGPWFDVFGLACRILASEEAVCRRMRLASLFVLRGATRPELRVGTRSRFLMFAVVTGHRVNDNYFFARCGTIAHNGEAARLPVCGNDLLPRLPSRRLWLWIGTGSPHLLVAPESTAAATSSRPGKCGILAPAAVPSTSGGFDSRFLLNDHARWHPAEGSNLDSRFWRPAFCR